MPQSQVAYLLDRISAVGADLSAAEQHWNTEDMSDVSLEAATFLREALDAPTLERVSSRGAKSTPRPWRR